MHDYRRAGQCLLLGILLPLIILGLHPTAHDIMEDPGTRVAAINHLVHGIAIVSQPLILVGLIALTQHLKWSLTATGAFVVYCLSLIAILIAALMSGFVGPDVIEQLEAADVTTSGDYLALLHYTHILNQVFAKFSVIAASLAFVLWSAGIQHTDWLTRVMQIAGFAIGAALGMSILFGILVLDVRGMLITTGLQAIWLALVAGYLLRTSRTLPIP